MLQCCTYSPTPHDHRAAVLALSVRAWSSVLPLTQLAVPMFVYEAFYPRGWQARQVADLTAVLDDEPDNVDVAMHGPVVTGWVCTIQPISAKVSAPLDESGTEAC